MAGLGHIRRDIDEAKASDPTKATELLGRSVSKTGFQDAITPPWHTNVTFLYWALCLGAFIWGFLILPWYVAIAWPIVFGIGKRFVGSLLPSPDSEYYRQKLIGSLESRGDAFRRAGDPGRVAAVEHMIALLRGSDQNV